MNSLSLSYVWVMCLGGSHPFAITIIELWAEVNLHNLCKFLSIIFQAHSRQKLDTLINQKRTTRVICICEEERVWEKEDLMLNKYFQYGFLFMSIKWNFIALWDSQGKLSRFESENFALSMPEKFLSLKSFSIVFRFSSFCLIKFWAS